MGNPDGTERVAAASPSFDELAMAALAVCVVAWAVARACLQSITLDEAATYRSFVATANPNHWAPHSNNHVLNSMLMRLATTVFGLSQLSVRLPALTGTCIYVASCYTVCRWAIGSKAVRVIVFACLILNPYLGDLFVAARGYSMAIGFLAAAIAAVARMQFRGGAGPAEVERTWMFASGCLGLSFTANFPFALVDAATWAALLIWTITSQPRKSRPPLWRLAACSTAPGAAAVLGIASWTLLHWPGGQLFYGAHSLAETFRTVVQGSLYEPNWEVANPLVFGAAKFVRPYLVPLLCGFAAAHLILSNAGRRYFTEEYGARKSFEFCLVLTGALAAAVAIHWIGFRLFGLLLPRDRTGIYIIPLFTLAAGALAAVPGYKRFGSIVRCGLVAMLAVMAVYYGLCLRSRYFIEWWSSADAKEAYYVLAYYNHRYNARAVASHLPLTDCLEFYRLASGRESFDEFVHSDPMPGGKDAYAGYESHDRGLIAREGLKVVYRGRIDNDVVVAIRPGLETGPR